MFGSDRLIDRLALRLSGAATYVRGNGGFAVAFGVAVLAVYCAVFVAGTVLAAFGDDAMIGALGRVSADVGPAVTFGAALLAIVERRAAA